MNQILIYSLNEDMILNDITRTLIVMLSRIVHISSQFLPRHSKAIYKTCAAISLILYLSITNLHESVNVTFSDIFQTDYLIQNGMIFSLNFVRLLSLNISFSLIIIKVLIQNPTLIQNLLIALNIY